MEERSWEGRRKGEREGEGEEEEQWVKKGEGGRAGREEGGEKLILIKSSITNNLRNENMSVQRHGIGAT